VMLLATRTNHNLTIDIDIDTNYAA